MGGFELPVESSEVELSLFSPRELRCKGVMLNCACPDRGRSRQADAVQKVSRLIHRIVEERKGSVFGDVPEVQADSN